MGHAGKWMLAVVLGAGPLAWAQASPPAAASKGRITVPSADVAALAESVRAAANDQERINALQRLVQLGHEGQLATFEFVHNPKPAIRDNAIFVLASGPKSSFTSNDARLAAARDKAIRVVQPLYFGTGANDYSGVTNFMRSALEIPAVLDSIFKEAEGGDRVRQLRALRLLRSLPPSARTLSAFARGLRARDQDTWMLAQEYLYLNRSQGGEEQLVAALTDSSEQVRSRAASRIVAKDRPDLAKRLADMVADSREDISTRRAAADSLRNAGPVGMEGLLSALSRADAKGQRVAAEAMSAFTGKQALASIRPLLKHADPAIRAGAARAIIHIRFNASDDYPTEELLELMDDANQDVAVTAAIALNNRSNFRSNWSPGPVTARRLATVRSVSDSKGMRTEFDQDAGALPVADWTPPPVRANPAARVAARPAPADWKPMVSNLAWALTLLGVACFIIIAFTTRGGDVDESTETFA